LTIRLPEGQVWKIFLKEVWQAQKFGVEATIMVDVGNKRLTIAYFYERGDLNSIPKVTTIIPKE